MLALLAARTTCLPGSIALTLFLSFVQFGLTEDIAVAIHAADGQKYKMSGQWSMDALKVRKW